jgi:hypothetical protein
MCDGTTPYPDTCGEPGRASGGSSSRIASSRPRRRFHSHQSPTIHNFPSSDVSVVTARLACTRRHMERLAASVEGELFDSEQGDGRHTDWCVPSSVAGGWSPRSAALPTPAHSHQLPAGLAAAAPAAAELREQ